MKSLASMWYEEYRGLHVVEQSDKEKKTVERTKRLLEAGCVADESGWYQDGVFLGKDARSATEALWG